MRGKVLNLTTEERLERARRACREPGIMYKVAMGGKDPTAPHCATIVNGLYLSDCVGFALWAYGRDRLDASSTWWNQNSIYNDALKTRKAWRFCSPYAGCLALIRGPVPAENGKPADKRIGHIGMLTDVEQWLVAHCSPSNHKRVGHSLAETPMRPQTFGKTRPIYFVEAIPR